MWDGNTAQFWLDNWSGAGAFCCRAPELFKIASRKNRSVCKEMTDGNWIRAVGRLSSLAQLHEFVDLTNIVSSIVLDPQRPNSITWVWTKDGAYSWRSAYLAQFVGSHPRFLTSKVWEAHMEPKCKVFSWLLLHNRILTADRLAIRGWPHDPTCQLCLGGHETATHLCKDCPFTREVRRLVCHWTGVVMAPAESFDSINEWWDASLPHTSKTARRRASGHLIYVWWNVWKERNCRIFNHSRLTFVEVAHRTFEDIIQRSVVFGLNAVGLVLEPN